MTASPVAVASVVAVTAAALAARLAFRIDYAEEPDSIRFLQAVEYFDVTLHQPHFPGYPVFVLLGKAFAAIFGSPLAGLATLCAVVGALLPAALALFARPLLGERAARWTLVFAAVNPLFWLFSQKLLSDMTGLLFLVSALALLAHGLTREGRGADRLVLAAAAVLGLTLGVRLSYYPFALSLAVLVLLRRRALLIRSALAGLAGVLVWAVPFVLVTGWGPLLDVARLQGGGHFHRWGGSIVTESDLGLRVAKLAWDLLAQGLGTWWMDRPAWLLVPTVALAFLAFLRLPHLRRIPREQLVFWAVLVVPYLVWAFFGQNITVKARHVLPLVALMVPLVAAMAAARTTPPFPFAAGVALAAGQLLVGWSLCAEHRATPSNGALLARELGRVCATSPNPVVVYTASLERHLMLEAPCVQPVKVLRLAEAKRDLAARPAGTAAFVVSDVSRVERLRREPVARFQRNRYVQNALNDLALYRLDGATDG